MSNLNEGIAAWRASVEQQLDKKSTDELEDHLRATIESLRPTGLPEEELLLLASNRLGTAERISAEFTKNDLFGIWRERAMWILFGFVPLPLALTALRDSAARIGSGALTWGVPPWCAAALTLLLPLFTAAVVAGLCLVVVRAASGLRSGTRGWVPATFTKLAALLVVVFLALHLYPGVLGLIYHARVVPMAKANAMQEYIFTYTAARQFGSLIFSAVAAVLLAWLATPRRAKRESVST